MTRECTHAKRPLKKLQSTTGVTLIEMIIVTTIFIVFLFQIGNTWDSVDRWIKYVRDRIDVHREVKVAYNFILGDLQETESIKATSDKWVLELIDMSNVIYEKEEDTLLRSKGMGLSFPVAHHIKACEFKMKANSTVYAYLTFKKGSAETELNVRIDQPEDEDLVAKLGMALTESDVSEVDGDSFDGRWKPLGGG